MTIIDLKKHIIQKSKELNIDIIGFCDTKPFSCLKEILTKRRQKGYETEFEEKDIELRINPQKILPNAKSIIAIGMSYNVLESSVNKNEITLKGQLSKSSWGIDYHVVLREKLQKLAKEIKKVSNFEYKIFVDTGPLLDREIAKKAGIGWYGKNNSIINNKFGSFIFIGYMITDLEINPDSIIKGECGSCEICIKSCPTKAISHGHTIDSRKCISYLTQTKQRIPYDLRDKMGVQIYGCDTCQSCCPRNKNVLKTENTPFIPHKTGGIIDINELFHMSNKEFKERHGHIAASWRGKNILKRNCIIALGNLKNQNSIGLLTKSINDKSDMIREYSAWALLKIDRKLGRKIIKEHIEREKDIKVRKEMERLLKYYRFFS